MAKGIQKDRQPGDQIRVNLNGSVADAVVQGSSALGISFSTYVQLRLLGKLEAPQNQAPSSGAGHLTPTQTTPVQLEPNQAVLTLADLPPV